VICPTKLSDPDRNLISPRASAAYIEIGADLHKRIDRDEINSLLLSLAWKSSSSNRRLRLPFGNRRSIPYHIDRAGFRSHRAAFG
jgi:hypothetical protein